MKKSNINVLKDIDALKTKMKEGFVVETSYDSIFTITGDYSLTEVKLTNGKLMILCVRILHSNDCKDNNILANAALQIIRTFSEKGTH